MAKIIKMILSHTPKPKPRILVEEALRRVKFSGKKYTYIPSDEYLRMQIKLKLGKLMK